jgi:hypothetical protein
MRQIKLFGLACAVVFVLAAAASSSASACNASSLPCFHGPYPIHFTTLQLKVSTFLTVGGRAVECSGGSSLGFILSLKDIIINGVIYTGCISTNFGGGKCQSGAVKGEIKTLSLLGLPGYINQATKLVGLLFEPGGSINHFASFECETLFGAEHLTVRGTRICDLSPVNTHGKKFHIVCEQKNGVQEPLSFGGLGTKDTLETKGEGPENFGFEQSGVSELYDILTLTLTLLLA